MFGITASAIFTIPLMIGAGYFCAYGKWENDGISSYAPGLACILLVFVGAVQLSNLTQFLMIFYSFFGFAIGWSLFWKKHETEGQRQQREMFEREDAAINGDAFDPKVSDSVLPKRAYDPEETRTPQTNTRTVVDSSDYDKLVALNGCSPITAQRIISKVWSGQKLTNHEQMFWNQLR